ncbi:PREDICTED: caspase-10 isoform X1 [Mandrillus leucophaeus]|uniref:caspase-10 isoform X1 n=1 Tax=Mandrillus leucophaeus TaxID=9568 RepID=UPI0005F4179C|nr:PREDICTED: caspase-10 isoform X1 [Mandrillus leucophaeus]
MKSQGSSSDKNCKVSFRKKLLIIDSDLGVEDVERLKFLCIGLVPNKKLEKSSSASDVFEHLLAEDLLSEGDSFFLAELLYIIGQKKLLQYLNYTEEKVEQLLPIQGKVSLFRNLLYELSQGIDSEDLKNMIFLLNDSLPKTEMTSLSFLALLEKQDKIDEDNLTCLEDLCEMVVPKFLRNIEKYKREKAAQIVTPPVDKEAESLYQGEEELVSQTDIKTFLEALPEESWQGKHARSNGNRATDGAPSLVSKGLQGASANTLNSETSTKWAPTYRMNRNHRGLCVIVNNHRFISLRDRRGTHKDAEILTGVFQWLGFTVHIYNDVTKGEMEEVLQKEKCNPAHADGDCFVFCILTHGEDGAVYSSDEALIPIREIMSHFTALQCPGLAEKPKLFFIQACQGEKIQLSKSIEADALNPEQAPTSLQDSIPVEADFLLGLATVPGYVSFRHVEEGSWYIQSLCNHLKVLVPRMLKFLEKTMEIRGRKRAVWGAKQTQISATFLPTAISAQTPRPPRTGGAAFPSSFQRLPFACPPATSPEIDNALQQDGNFPSQHHLVILEQQS